MSRQPFIASILALCCAAAVQAETNTVTLDQSGALNEAEITQYDAGNVASVSQDGYANTVIVEQRTEGPPHTAQITQVGNENAVRIVQAEVHGSEATLYQQGNGNDFTVTQRAYVNTLDASAVGNGNVQVIEQLGFGDAVTRQFGNDNRIGVVQETYGQGGSADLTQTGERNELDVTQFGSRYYLGTTTFTQTGNDNVASVAHDGGFSTIDFAQTGDRNDAQISQGARDGTLSGQQLGNDNEVILEQSFDSPTLLVLQDGNANFADVLQASYEASADLSQIGNDNQATIRQITESLYGGDTAIVTQQGNGNVANLLQQ